MERERQRHSQQVSQGGEGPSPEHDLDSTREKLEGLLRVADKVMDSIPPLAAEEYLQQSRQRGAQ